MTIPEIPPKTPCSIDKKAVKRPISPVIEKLGKRARRLKQVPQLKKREAPANQWKNRFGEDFRVGTTFKGETCGYCKVDAYITEATLLKLLDKGLKSQNLEVVAIHGKPQGTPYGLVAPLIESLRRKGIIVR